MFAGFLCGARVSFSARGSAVRTASRGVRRSSGRSGLPTTSNPLSAYFRFVVQIGAGSAVVAGGMAFAMVQLAPGDLAVTCLFVAFLINAMNLLDGMDGLAASVAAVACLGFVVISVESGNTVGIVVAGSLLGACAAVLFVNAPPATMFMGDSGSTLLGVVLAFLSLNWTRSQAGSGALVVPLIFSPCPSRTRCSRSSGACVRTRECSAETGGTSTTFCRSAVGARKIFCAWRSACRDFWSSARGALHAESSPCG